MNKIIETTFVNDRDGNLIAIYSDTGDPNFSFKGEIVDSEHYYEKHQNYHKHEQVISTFTRHVKANKSTVLLEYKMWHNSLQEYRLVEKEIYE